MHIAVVGGGGYIGSHMVKLLIESGHKVTVLDNFCTGYRDAARFGEVIEVDLATRDVLFGIVAESAFDAVMHFASYIQVGESVDNPAKYYQNNVVNTLNLLDAMVAAGVKQFVFSSTAAVFGEPQYVPIDEKHSKNPLNPYGRSKLMVEQILSDYDKAYGLKSICLRYFNAAGADPAGELGERHNPETHLIPLILQVASGARDSISVFGTDYDTHDGTCVRDYIHISDLCDAHLHAVERLNSGAESCVYNLGNGNGYSVREVIEVVREVTGHSIPVVECERRAGDPARLVADSSLAREQLGWIPKYSSINEIVAHAWKWQKSQ